MKRRKGVAGDGTPTDHVVQVFDSADSLAGHVAAFLRKGILGSDTLLVIMRNSHWQAVAMRLRADGVSIDTAAASGQVIVRDAAARLKLFMRRGLPDGELFDRYICSQARELASRGKRLRIYGEMVDLLAAEGEFEGAQRLEALWNQLGARESFILFCGYSAVHFGDPRSSGALRSICHSHSEVWSDPQDMLGSFLLEAYAAHAYPNERSR